MTDEPRCPKCGGPLMRGMCLKCDLISYSDPIRAVWSKASELENVVVDGEWVWRVKEKKPRD